MAVPILWPQGNTHTPLGLVLQSLSGNILDLTGVNPANIVLHKRPNLPVSNASPLTGSATIVGNPQNGTITFTFSAADVATPGTYLLGGAVTYPDTSVQTLFEQVFIVKTAQ